MVKKIQKVDEMKKIIFLLSLAMAFTAQAEKQTERERLYQRTVAKEDASFRRYVRLNDELRSLKKSLNKSEERLAEGKWKKPAWYLFQESLPEKVERLKEEITELQAKVDEAIKTDKKLVAVVYADYIAQ